MIAHTDLVSHGMLAASAAGVVTWSVAREHGIDRRSVAVCAGAASTVAALSPGVESAAAATYTGHMLQHLALILVAAPCLAWGLRPSMSARRSHVPIGTRRRMRRCAHGVVAMGFPITLLATHLTGWYETALDDQPVHDLEHVAYLASAIGLWSLVVGRGTSSSAARIAASFATIVATAFVGIVLTTSATPLVAAYEVQLGRAAALADQRQAGALMWTSTMLAALPLLIATFWRWAAREQRCRERVEQLLDRPTDGPVDHERSIATNG